MELPFCIRYTTNNIHKINLGAPRDWDFVYFIYISFIPRQLTNLRVYTLHDGKLAT